MRRSQSCGCQAPSARRYPNRPPASAMDEAQEPRARTWEPGPPKALPRRAIPPAVASGSPLPPQETRPPRRAGSLARNTAQARRDVHTIPQHIDEQGFGMTSSVAIRSSSLAARKPKRPPGFSSYERRTTNHGPPAPGLGPPAPRLTGNPTSNTPARGAGANPFPARRSARQAVDQADRRV